MATVYRRADSDVYTAAFKTWDARAGDWKWVSKSTGVTDESIASGIAATLERAGGEAKAGVLTRDKALAMVNSILKLAGLDEVTPVPSLEKIVENMLADANVSEGSLRKYNAQWKAFKTWAGTKVKRAVDAWTPDEVAEYYRNLRSKHSAGTANDHMRFMSMAFGRAVKLGHRPSNPAHAVNRVEDEKRFPSDRQHVLTQPNAATGAGIAPPSPAT
jgi:hypothetical protein